MKSIGVIAEYNPFHNGHAYQLAHIRQQLSADVIVVVMSGNFLQRGEPAAYDKWTRATWALQSGADLVIELPVAYSVQSADYFAQGGIQILEALGIAGINFGVESGSAAEFIMAADWFVNHEQEIVAILQEEYCGESYPQRLADAVRTLHPTFPLDMTQPNNTLGFSYCKQLIKQASTMTVTTLERKDAGYHQSTLDPQKAIASATAIRQGLVTNSNLVDRFLPPTVVQSIKQHQLATWDCWWPMLQYQITVSTEEQLATIYEMPAGLPRKLKYVAAESSSFIEFVEALLEKHTTRVKIQRLCLYILLELTDDMIKEVFCDPIPLHILGFTSAGKNFLNEQKHHVSNPLLANINQQTASYWAQDIKAGNIYRLGMGMNVPKQDFTRHPVIL